MMESPGSTLSRALCGRATGNSQRSRRIGSWRVCWNDGDTYTHTYKHTFMSSRLDTFGRPPFHSSWFVIRVTDASPQQRVASASLRQDCRGKSSATCVHTACWWTHETTKELFAPTCIPGMCMYVYIGTGPRRRKHLSVKTFHYILLFSYESFTLHSHNKCTAVSIHLFSYPYIYLNLKLISSVLSFCPHKESECKVNPEGETHTFWETLLLKNTESGLTKKYRRPRAQKYMRCNHKRSTSIPFIVDICSRWNKDGDQLFLWETFWGGLRIGDFCRKPAIYSARLLLM